MNTYRELALSSCKSVCMLLCVLMSCVVIELYGLYVVCVNSRWYVLACPVDGHRYYCVMFVAWLIRIDYML